MHLAKRWPFPAASVFSCCCPLMLTLLLLLHSSIFQLMRVYNLRDCLLASGCVCVWCVCVLLCGRVLSPGLTAQTLNCTAVFCCCPVGAWGSGTVLQALLLISTTNESLQMQRQTLRTSSERPNGVLRFLTSTSTRPLAARPNGVHFGI